MSSTRPPAVTVVMATWGREAHILPSIRSVLGQDLGDFELLVVGDACTDGTGATVASVEDARVAWINLEQHWGSQSGPNNAGIAAARARYVAYIGHDDIWEPFHLSDLLRTLEGPGRPDFAVGGAILHGPPDVPRYRVTGLFDDSAAAARHFFPPSSIAHRRGVSDVIGPWPRPEAVALPVDSDFMLRAVAAGMRFAATGRISVHKFSAVQRHLCYLLPESGEQADMLADLGRHGHADRVAALVEASRARGDYMAVPHADVTGRAPGDLFRRSQARRGSFVPDLVDLGRKRVLEQVPMNHGPQWQPRPVRGFRFSLRTARPRFPLAVTAGEPVSMVVKVGHDRPEALEHLALACNGVDQVATPLNPVRRTGEFWARDFVTGLRLRPDRASVLEFRLTAEQTAPEGGRGLAIGRIRLTPSVP